MFIRMGLLKPIPKTLFKAFFSSILIIFSLSILIFSLVYLSPGEELLQEYILSIEENKNEITQNFEDDNTYSEITREKRSIPHFIQTYLSWLSSSISGNLGVSSSNGLPVLEQVLNFTANTLYLILSSLLISLAIAFPMVMLYINNSSPFFVRAANTIIRLLSFLPLFWLAYVLIYLSISFFDYYPLAMDYDEISFSKFILPVILLCFGSGVLVEIFQQLTYEIKRVLAEEYILCARAKGASVFKHLLKEGIAFPLLNLFSNRVAYLFGATIIIEQIFNWPGIGRLTWQATQDRDIPLLLGAVIISAIVIRTAHFISHLIYVLINPRASHE